MAKTKLQRAADILGGLLKLAGRLHEAIQSGDSRQVDRVLPPNIRTTLERQLTEAKAREKYGPRPGSQ